MYLIGDEAGKKEERKRERERERERETTGMDFTAIIACLWNSLNQFFWLC